MSTVLGARAQRVVGGQRLDVEDVEPGAGDAPAAERRDQRGLVDDRPARGVDQVAPSASSAPARRAPTSPRVRSPSTQVDGHDVGAREQLVLGHRGRAAAAARSAVRFWLQAITSIPKARPTRATREPSRPSPRTPSVRPRGRPERVLPAALAHRAVLGGDVAGERQDQRPGQLGRRGTASPPVPQTMIAALARRPRGRSRRCAIPVVTSRREVRQPLESARGNGVRSRMATTTSKSAEPRGHARRRRQVAR